MALNIAPWRQNKTIDTKSATSWDEGQGRCPPGLLFGGNWRILGVAKLSNFKFEPSLHKFVGKALILDLWDLVHLCRDYDFIDKYIWRDRTAPEANYVTSERKFMRLSRDMRRFRLPHTRAIHICETGDRQYARGLGPLLGLCPAFGYGFLNELETLVHKEKEKERFSLSKSIKFRGSEYVGRSRRVCLLKRRKKRGRPSNLERAIVATGVCWRYSSHKCCALCGVSLLWDQCKKISTNGLDIKNITA